MIMGLGIGLAVGAVAVFIGCCARGGIYDSWRSYCIGVLTGALLGSGIALLVIPKLLQGGV